MMDDPDAHAALVERTGRSNPNKPRHSQNSQDRPRNVARDRLEGDAGRGLVPEDAGLERLIV